MRNIKAFVTKCDQGVLMDAEAGMKEVIQLGMEGEDDRQSTRIANTDCLKACSWFDRDIGQLQTMIDEAREAMDDAEKTVRNKHSAASTGTQQPCDLVPLF